MACVEAPTCRDALNQRRAKWVHASTASDGICSSSQHQQQNPNSDHDFGEAWDATDDPLHGYDSRNELDRLRREAYAGNPRGIKYGISDRQMFSSYSAYGYGPWEWRPYTGSNPHTTHGHLSIHSSARNQNVEWFTTPKVMRPADRRFIQALVKKELDDDTDGEGYRYLRLRARRMRGEDVKKVQICLKIPYTKKYGFRTSRKVKEFQRYCRVVLGNLDINVTGKVDRKTWEAILFINIAHFFGF